MYDKVKVHTRTCHEGMYAGGGGINVYFYPFFNLGARQGVLSTGQDRFTASKRDSISILQATGWASGPVGTDTENLVPTGFHRHTRCESLYCNSFTASLQGSVIYIYIYINPLQNPTNGCNTV